ncbi:MAG: DUF4397 domain-containing protein, partial [Gemmatimonadaceae bacterium]
MRLRFATLVLTAIAGLTLNGCDPGEVGPTGFQPTQPFGRMRFVNGIPNSTADPVNVLVEGTPFAINIGYAAAAPASPNLYYPVYQGSRQLAVRRTADTATKLLDQALTIAASTDYTVIAVGPRATVSTVVTTDDNSVPTAGMVKIRAVNAAPSTATVDVYVTAPNASIAAIAPTFPGLAFRSASSYLQLAAGSVQVRFTTPGTK